MHLKRLLRCIFYRQGICAVLVDSRKILYADAPFTHTFCVRRNDHTIFNLFWDWSRIIDRANRVKSDPDKRQRTFRFGVFAVVYALLALACIFALLLFRLLPVGFFLNVLITAFAVAIGGAGTLICAITALIFWFCQLSLNRRPITWISLALVLAIIALTVGVPFLFFA